MPTLAQDIRSSESITVERILIDARVTDDKGDPILGLTPASFHVKIDGKRAQVESVEWIPENAAARALADEDEKPKLADVPAADAPIEEPRPAGRLIVVFFQTDFARNAVRTTGQMKILSYADEFLESLEPEDRVAVLSYDSHLKFRLDFTTDRTAARDAIRNSLLIDEPPTPQMVPMPRLGARLKPEELRETRNQEKAFILLANALRPIPGPKTMVLFGWGLGYRLNGRIFMAPDYEVARRALEAARVTCFSLDITQADGHDLAAGLATAAADTGGFYASTYHFPQMAIDRLERTLAGHYELEVRKPETKRTGVHTIEVTVDDKRAVVLARSGYTDRE